MSQTVYADLPGGRVSKTFPDGTSDATVKAAFAGEYRKAGTNSTYAKILEQAANPMAGYATQGDYLAAHPQGSITATQPSLGDRLQEAVRGLGAHLGIGSQFADKTTNFLNDLTPVGAVTGAWDAGKQFANSTTGPMTWGKAGTGALALASLGASILPYGQDARMALQAGQQPLKGMFGRLLGDESGAIRGWHGSAADFDHFSNDFIGTGEGAQGYGYGHYVAESKRLASSYKNPKLDTYYPPNSGHLYEVNINAEPSQFINLNTPLINQPRPVLDLGLNANIDHLGAGSRQRVMMEHLRAGTENQDYPVTGNMLHDIMTKYGSDVGANKQFSETLAGHGFAGLQYGQPVGALGGGGRNYVVFDPSLISILNKH